MRAHVSAIDTPLISDQEFTGKIPRVSQPWKGFHCFVSFKEPEELKRNLSGAPLALEANISC